jgi:hypothetical protein
MFNSPLFPVTISLMAVLAGLLIYRNPPTRPAVFLRRVAFTAMVCSALLMTLSTSIMDTKTGAFLAVVFDPTGQSLIVPNPYGYYLHRGGFLPAITVTSLGAAFICPLVYLAQARNNRRRKRTVQP